MNNSKPSIDRQKILCESILACLEEMKKSAMQAALCHIELTTGEMTGVGYEYRQDHKFYDFAVATGQEAAKYEVNYTMIMQILNNHPQEEVKKA